MAQYVVLPDGSRCYSGSNCLRHRNKGLPADFATKTVTEQLKDMEALKNPLSSKTPKEVDTQIAELFEEYYKAMAPLHETLSRLDNAKKRLERNTSERFRESTENDIIYLENKVNEYRQIGKEILAEAVPYEVEYSRRPWTRGFLVRNSNGHVHKNRSCSTCTRSTQYYWLTEYSGKNEEELVADAGESACTVCYPTAPVNVLQRASRIQDPRLRAQQEQRDAIQNERDRKNAEKLAKSIRNPDGSRLEDSSGFEIKTVVSAENAASDIHSDMKAVREGKREVYNPDYYVKREQSYNKIMAALAHKKGLTVDEVEQQLKPNFDRKYKKEWQ